MMPTLDADSVDAIVTDPPYGLEFMGKDWDKLAIRNDGNPSMRPKGKHVEQNIRGKWQPGVVYGSPKKNPRCRKCGVLKHTPKDGSRQMCQCDPPDWDTRQYEYAQQQQLYHQQWAEAAFRVAKPGAHLVAFGGTRTHHRLMCAIEDAGWEIRDCCMLFWVFGSGFPKSHNLHGDWEGWGTALKPAYEPIVLARKPLSGTVAANIQRYGTGALNIDGCRVGIGGDERGVIDRRSGGGRDTTKEIYAAGLGRDKGERFKSHSAGRWPANLCLDEEAAAMLDAQSGTLTPSSSYQRKTPVGNNVYGKGAGQKLVGDLVPSYADTGGASRFFYCAKASRAERGEGNNHPTVKPLALMRWLVRLVTPPGALVLDPFMGSGTTGIAAILEGFNFVGIEQEVEYVEIARARLEHWATKEAQLELT